MPTKRRRWDIFCHVVDNMGDIGVCWRLARQLVVEHGLEVRLWVDDLAAFARIAPQLDPAARRACLQGVEILPWLRPFPGSTVPDVVIEAFGCEVPTLYLEAMAKRQPVPAWINIEYLSAENWAAGCHGLPSPHPRVPLTRHFFFPGFGPGTGGLLREHDLLARRDQFRANGADQANLWRRLGVATPPSHSTTVSLFCYPNNALPALINAWAEGPSALTCIVPEGPAADSISESFAPSERKTPRGFARGRLALHIVSFVDQDSYDKLLWTCHFNFVRGEDSFVRAQWAGRPMVWQAYPQEDGVHWNKIETFLGLYEAGMSAAARRSLGLFWRAWNRGDPKTGEAWVPYVAQRTGLDIHANQWATQLANQSDLATRLVDFANSKL